MTQTFLDFTFVSQRDAYYLFYKNFPEGSELYIATFDSTWLYKVYCEHFDMSFTAMFTCHVVQL